MGGISDEAREDELPRHEVSISSFYLDKHQVTNKDFKKFVDVTGYITTAEKAPDINEIKKQLRNPNIEIDPELLKPAALVFTPPSHKVPLTNPVAWWTWVTGANWKNPYGDNKKIKYFDDLPVVQVSWFDANAYCKWLGKRLPTEAEWEWASKAGDHDAKYTWGNEDIDEGKVKANIWQGEFPHYNNLKDKFYRLAPIKNFPPNKYGLYDMAGNTWEWVNDNYDYDYYKSLAGKISYNPQGPDKSFDPQDRSIKSNSAKKVLKGGSYLCNKSYCTGYRISARMKSTSDTSMEHIGFRCARSK